MSRTSAARTTFVFLLVIATLLVATTALAQGTASAPADGEDAHTEAATPNDSEIAGDEGDANATTDGGAAEVGSPVEEPGSGGSGVAPDVDADATALDVQVGATAEPGPSDLLPKQRLVYDDITGIRLNPIGLETRAHLDYRLRLWDDPGILFRDAYLGLGGALSVSPAVARIGAKVTFKPLAVLQLAAAGYFVQWYGTFGHLQSFPTPEAPHSDTDLERNDDVGLGYDTNGFDAELQAQLLGKVGPIVLRNEAKFTYSDLDLFGGDDVFYNARVDFVVPNGGWMVQNDTDLVWLSDFGVVAGVRATLLHSFYRESDFLFGESAEDTENTPAFRVGPLLAWVISDELSDEWNKPTLIAMANWYLLHRYRTGEDVEQWIPYVAIAFKFEGELWSSAR